MAEFRIEGEALRRQARFRVLSWGSVLSLLAVTVLLFTLRASGDLGADSNLRFLAAFTFLGAVVVACVLAWREVLRLAERQMVFVLEENEIVRKRRGWPDVKIAFSEIKTLREELRWLVIQTTEPQKKIAIPNGVSGYDVIRAELARHHPLSAPPALKFPLKASALLAAAVLSWAAVVWFRDARIVIPAGIAALLTLAFGSHHTWTLLRGRLRPLLLWTSLGSAWLLAIVLICFSVVRSCW